MSGEPDAVTPGVVAAGPVFLTCVRRAEEPHPTAKMTTMAGKQTQAVRFLIGIPPGPHPRPNHHPAWCGSVNGLAPIGWTAACGQTKNYSMGSPASQSSSSMPCFRTQVEF